MNIWELHMSSKYWDEPEKFNPRRFLSQDGKTVLRPPAWNPFGMGETRKIREYKMVPPKYYNRYSGIYLLLFIYSRLFFKKQGGLVQLKNCFTREKYKVI